MQARCPSSDDTTKSTTACDTTTVVGTIRPNTDLDQYANEGQGNYTLNGTESELIDILTTLGKITGDGRDGRHGRRSQHQRGKSFRQRRHGNGNRGPEHAHFPAQWHEPRHSVSTLLLLADLPAVVEHGGMLNRSRIVNRVGVVEVDKVNLRIRAFAVPSRFNVSLTGG